MNHAASQLRQIGFAFLVASCLLVNPAVLSASSGSVDTDGALVESTANFIYERSGVNLSTEAKRRLSFMEQQTLAGLSSRISVQQLAALLTDILLERLSTLTDQEIERAAKTFRNDPDPRYEYILLSWDGKHTSTRRQFVAAVKSFRDKSRHEDAAFRATLRQFVEGREIGEGVKGRVKIYSETLPEQFGQALDDGLTPVQSVLVLYSLASDDIISASTSGLRAEMEREHQTIGGSRYPNPEGHFPFGAQGYLFPTPIDLIFNDTIIGSLLDRMEKKTQAQLH